MKIGAVIPAAGQGKRMKTRINKQYLQLAGRPLLTHTIDIFTNDAIIDQIVVVVGKDEIEYCRQEIIQKYNLGNVKLVAGGETRQQSVYAGLMALSPAISYVIIHDGARPLLPKSVLKGIVNKLEEYKAITAGVKVKDTIKIKDKQNYVTDTLARDRLMAIQTPQAFEFDLICKAHEAASGDLVATDDASLVEALGHEVKVIEGSYQNIKITTPVDMKYANAILRSKQVNNEK
jgi:2-C-methyl-D-erythritol 4-phosphate cytidylyltransferase